MPVYAVQSPTNPMRGLYRGDVGYSFGTLTAAALAASPNGLSRAAGGIVTATTTGNHNFAAGELVTLADSSSKIVSVGGTRFGGNYLIQTVPSATTLTLLPLDEVVLHQAADTGGGGAATSVAFDFLQGSAPIGGKAFALAQIGDTSQGPFAFYVDGIFSAAPGVFEIDAQGAEVDAENRYQTVLNGAISVVDATNFTFHFDASFSGVKFARLKLRTLTNNVGLIATIRG
jgi:hypothetical protein